MYSPSEAISANSTKLFKKFNTCLQNLDIRPIRGEFNVGIYWFHSLQSIRHYLAVDLISAVAFQRSHSPAVIHLKIWLSLPQNATQTISSVTLLDSIVQTFQLPRPDRRSHILPRSPLTSPNHTILDQRYRFRPNNGESIKTHIVPTLHKQT